MENGFGLGAHASRVPSPPATASNLNGLEYRESEHARCVRSQANHGDTEDTEKTILIFSVFPW